MMMRKRIGSILFILGLLLLAAALALFAYNLIDGRRADQAAQTILSELQEQMPAIHPKQDVMGEDEASMPILACWSFRSLDFSSLLPKAGAIRSSVSRRVATADPGTPEIL